MEIILDTVSLKVLLGCALTVVAAEREIRAHRPATAVVVAVLAPATTLGSARSG